MIIGKDEYNGGSSAVVEGYEIIGYGGGGGGDKTWTPVVVDSRDRSTDGSDAEWGMLTLLLLLVVVVVL